MKLLLPFLLGSFLAMTYGATLEHVEAARPTEVAEEAEEYRWRRKVGQNVEQAGKWLQGKYTALSEEEEEEMELTKAAFHQLSADVEDNLRDVDDDIDQDEDEVFPYRLGKKFRKWKKKIVDAGKKVGTAVVVNKVAGAVAAVSG